MTSKERMLCALAGEKADRLPATVHEWQDYHLQTYLGGMSIVEAFAKFGLDAEVPYSGGLKQSEAERGVGELAGMCSAAGVSSAQWRVSGEVLRADADGRAVALRIETPEGALTCKTGGDRKTTWVTEHLVKRDEDIELLAKYMPVPSVDLEQVSECYDEVGDGGILRGGVWGDQPGCWQHAACLMDINDLILACFDKPDWVHRFLGILLEKKLRFVESMAGGKFDVIETGGGASSSTLISPQLHEEFCLPYDRQLHDALHGLGFKVSYHTCGGTVGIEEHIVANGSDASETLAPTSIGGNQEPWEYAAKIGGPLALIGGLDQYSVLTDGPAERIRSKVFELFEKVGQDGGYILSLADHFFDAPVEHLQAYADAARECTY